MERLNKFHLPRVISAILVMACFVAVAGVVLAQLEGPAVQWVNRAPEYGEKLQKFSDGLLHPAQKPETTPVRKPEGSSNPNANATASPHAPIQFDYQTILNWTGATLTESVEVIVLLFLLLTSDDWLSEKLEQILPNMKGQQWAAGSISEIQRNISAYLFTISLINVALGVIVATGLALMHFPNAIMWGVMAALLNYIPYFGPIVGIILVGLVSVFTLDSLTLEVLPMCWYLLIHLLEADLFTPILLAGC
jgi:predicted PurR-regulated permease PerM